MQTFMSYFRDIVRFVAAETTAVVILVAVLAVSIFAFVGADQELVLALLVFGLVSAVVEARMHARVKDGPDAS